MCELKGGLTMVKSAKKVLRWRVSSVEVAGRVAVFQKELIAVQFDLHPLSRSFKALISLGADTLSTKGLAVKRFFVHRPCKKLDYWVNVRKRLPPSFRLR